MGKSDKVQTKVSRASDARGEKSQGAIGDSLGSCGVESRGTFRDPLGPTVRATVGAGKPCERRYAQAVRLEASGAPSSRERLRSKDRGVVPATASMRKRVRVGEGVIKGPTKTLVGSER